MTIVHKQRTIILAALFGSIVIGYGWFTVRQRQARLDAGLFSAVEDHNAARVQALVSAGADPNAREPLVPSTSFLQWFRRAFAGLRGHPAIQQPILVRVLFQLEMDDRNPETIAEDERIAKLLLQAGASGNASDEDGFTPLTLAVFCKQADLVHPMLSQGADPNATTTSGIWPLYVAAGDGTSEQCTDMLRHGAQTQIGGMSALFQAVSYGRADNVRLLLSYGADPNWRDERKNCLIFWAYTYRHKDIARMLFKAGAKGY